MVQIQPYFPEPVVVSKNVATERYVVRLSFVRAVLSGHVVTVVGIAAVASLLDPALSVNGLLVVLLAGLLALTFTRRLLVGRSLDGVISFFLLLPVLYCLGGLTKFAVAIGQPVWIFIVAYGIASIYGALCGRDYSFVGQFVIAAVLLTVVVGSAVLLGAVDWRVALLWWSVSLAYVFFLVYDLAALLSRRRLGEEPAAVADLYRDMLNFSTYSVRIFLHWRRFGPI